MTPIPIVICCCYYLLIMVHGFHIDVVREDALTFRGKNITEENIHSFLEDHERILLFGKNAKDHTKYALVNVKHKPRRKRSSSEKTISFSVNNKIDENINLQFKKSNKLLDDAFVYIKRFANSSVLIDNFHKLAEQYDDCFYRNENSALDVCEGDVRGMVRHNMKVYLIHPLPIRFGKSVHIMVEAIDPFMSDTIIMSTDNRFSVTSNPKQIGQPQQRPLCMSEPEVEYDLNYLNIHQLNNGSSTSGNSNNSNESASTRRIPSERGYRLKRFISGTNKVPRVLHIETAIFVDKDLYRHMTKNYPKDTESKLIRFVLAMINGVQLLYHHPSLGHEINFVLKRLEILHNDPKGLRRASDIDVFLNSFCLWQRKFNPVSDVDAVHFDHAVILTGLDLYVVSKNGKVSSQVVGLAPVAGMCTATSSCTINEGKHFESVFVVAHEIGHNLGMRHDTSENNCDPSLYIMSPTLGSGKITWSKCSRNYLETFLGTHQAKCLFDRGHFGSSLDHAAEDLLPGERFDADQQCLLKYGKNSVRSQTQELSEICRDLHCQRDRYTWTSHPSLEGTKCGNGMWCRSGTCIAKGTILGTVGPQIRPSITSTVKSHTNFVEETRYGNLKQEFNFNTLPTKWNDWKAPSDCESGCLYGESGRLREGSTGLRVFERTCLDQLLSRKKCTEFDRKYESCISKQCYNVPRTTVLEFANQICERAKKFDKDILSEGIQEVSANPQESCKVYCRSTSGVPKTKSWIYPDGTTCKNTDSDIDDLFYCVNGKCEKFSCDNSTTNLYKTDPMFCPHSQSNVVQQENGRDFKSLAVKQQQQHTDRLVDNDSAKRTAHPSGGFRRKSDIYAQRNFKGSEAIGSGSKYKSNKWEVKSGCHFSCMEYSKGIQVVASKTNNSTNIQLCEPDVVPCDRLQSAANFANKLCQKYQVKVRGLSGNGMQILPSVQDPDRGCRVGCQDEYLRHRFYLVSGEQGHFPFGTKCSRNDNRYCVNGKCLEFGLDNIPLHESYISLAVIRNKRNIHEGNRRVKRNYLYYSPVNITERISSELLQSIIENFEIQRTYDMPVQEEQIDFLNPVHISMDEDYV